MSALVTALKILKTAHAASELATRAIEAANDGDEGAAEEYLRQARSHYDASRAAWDAAG